MIYVIRAIEQDLVKIGFTKNNDTLKRRLKTLKGACPDKLVIEAKMNGSKLKERCLHSFCISRHVTGEWFRLTKEEVQRMIEKYHKWSPTKEGIERQSTLSSKCKKKKKRYFR
jgi:hypothetical protein